MITFTMKFDGNGQMRIVFHGLQKTQAPKAAKFTQAISDAMGKTIERHVGDHDHHDHGHDHDHVHHSH